MLWVRGRVRCQFDFCVPLRFTLGAGAVFSTKSLDAGAALRGKVKGSKYVLFSKRTGNSFSQTIGPKELVVRNSASGKKTRELHGLLPKPDH